ncbi:cohesin subunit SA-3 [Protopterus annectens]|uniref:cohesin subunit SA-3 n=1 Tax=Protopterus annectens TaxID=7888 RepID=UPI001CF9FAE7|nr:cohesin subunit SA-3 [Protopterus annectens]
MFSSRRNTRDSHRNLERRFGVVSSILPQLYDILFVCVGIQTNSVVVSVEEAVMPLVRAARPLPKASSLISNGSFEVLSPRAQFRRGLKYSNPASSQNSELELLLADEAPHVKDVGSERDLTDFLSDSGSDFEDTLTKGKKRTACKTPRSTPASKRTKQDIGHTLQKTSGKQNSARQTDGLMETCSLFDAVKTAKSAMQCVVDDWLDSYKQQKETGLLELINFFIRSCGCKGTVSTEMFRIMQNTEIIHKMTEEFDEESGDYPLTMIGSQWKKFRMNFCEFISVLVRQCQYSVIYDEFLMDVVISLLTGLSDSQVRAFRHTSTLAAVKMMSALVDVALNVGIHKDNNQRQYESERNKPPSKRATEKLESLLQKHKELEENQEIIQSMMNAIFKGVFVHRYRDSVPDIRSICMEEIGMWMIKYSESFLSDGYLKYVGWMLHDKQGEVRLTCLKTLQAVYSHKELSQKMELFTSRFKARLVAMTLDKEYDVAVEAVRVLTLIQQNVEDALTSEDCENVYPLVYAAHRGVASAAGEFLYEKLFHQFDLSNQNTDKESGRRSPNGHFFKLILSFFIESELHEHAAYLVDSLWDCAGHLLKDWEGMTELLLEEVADDDEGLTDKDEAALIEIMVCSMKQAVEVHPPIGRAVGKKALTAKERKMKQDDKSRLTNHLILVLPQLLAKYSADAEKVTSLLQALHYFDLDVYCTGRLEKYLDLLLKQICDIVEKHTELDVLDACARAFYILCNEEYTFYNRANVARSQLVDLFVDKLSQDVEELLQGWCPDEAEVYSVAATMKRIAAFHNVHDLTKWELFDPFYHLLKKEIETGDLPEQIMVPALKFVHFDMVWKLSQVSTSTPAMEKILELKKQLKLFCGVCQSCLSAVHMSVRDQAFILLSDVLLIFSHQMVNGDCSFLEPLVLKPEPSLESELASFIMDYVFVDLEEEEADGASEDEAAKIGALHKRRSFLAGFCKLVIYNVLDLNAATDIFKNYMKYYNDYGDIIKETLSKARQIDKVQCAKTLVLSLQQLFTELIVDMDPFEAQSTPAFTDIRDLARRFALTFGLDPLKHREPIVMLHKDGIKFAFKKPHPRGPRYPPLNLPFLEILSEFSFKLLKQDKSILLNYLEKMRSSQLAFDQTELWVAFSTYRNSLKGTPDEETMSLLSGKASTVRRRKGPMSSAKRRKPDVSNAGSDVTWTSGKLKTPPLTSTLLREPRKPLVQTRRQKKKQEEYEDDQPDSNRGSESDFIQSRSWLDTQAVNEQKHLSDTPTSSVKQLINNKMELLSLMEEEDVEEEREILIEDAETSDDYDEDYLGSYLPTSRRTIHTEHRCDLFDSTVLDIDEFCPSEGGNSTQQEH